MFSSGVTNSGFTKNGPSAPVGLYPSSKIKLASSTYLRIRKWSRLNIDGDEFKTNYFTENTEVQSSLIKLINDDNTNTTPTYQITVTSISDIYREIRDKIFLSSFLKTQS